MIRLSEVSKTYRGQKGKVKVLENINLTIERGDFVTVMGPSGSGKSTLLSIMGLLSEPSGGNLEIDGQDAACMSERVKKHLRGQKFGFVFQFPSLVNTLNVHENILLPKMFGGRVSADDVQRAKWLAGLVGLDAKMHNRSYELSGGEQRRAALARALMNTPEVIYADEPTGALDTDTADKILDLFREVNAAGTTILIVTHDPHVTQSANRKLRLDEGRLTE